MQGGSAYPIRNAMPASRHTLGEFDMKPVAMRLAVLSALTLLGSMSAHGQTPQGTAFPYQGQLKSGGSAASGSFSMVFRLWNDPALSAPTNQIGPTLTFDGAGGNPPPVT